MEINTWHQQARLINIPPRRNRRRNNPLPHPRPRGVAAEAA